MSNLTLVLGGARSGKSRYALTLAIPYQRVLFVATAQAYDAEMAQRITRHKAERPSHWHTLEAPTNVSQAISARFDAHELILIDCLTLLSSNIMLGLAAEADTETIETAVLAEVNALITTHAALSTDTIIISNEVGLGIVPSYPSGRSYRDALGRANQHLAACADQVIFMVAGLPLIVK